MKIIFGQIFTLSMKNIRNEYKELNINENFEYFKAVSEIICVCTHAPCTSYQ